MKDTDPTRSDPVNPEVDPPPSTNFITDKDTASDGLFFSNGDTNLKNTKSQFLDEHSTLPDKFRSFGEMHQYMVELLAPPSLIIDSNNNAVHLSEHVSRYLNISGGRPTVNVLDLVHADLRDELESLLQVTRGNAELTVAKSRVVSFNDGQSTLILHARTLLMPDLEGFVLVIFEEENVPHQEGRSNDVREELQLSKQKYQDLKEDHEAVKEELNAYNEELEVSNEELRLAIDELHKSNIELSDARVKAESAAKIQSVFLANMSHELRTPMNGIIGMADLLKYETSDPEMLELIHTIQRSGDILLKVLNDILDYSKIDAGKLELEYIEFDLWECLEDVTTLFSLKAQQKKIEICLLIHNDIPQKVMGDPYRLSQIISNLLGNAIKFTEVGEIVVEVVLKRRHMDSFLISFEVRDTGGGIPEHRQKAIFEAFQQLDSTITRQHGGTGLGLAICKTLTLLMKGNISLESQEEVGSSFCVTVPFDAAPSSSLAGTQGDEQFQEVHILVLDEHRSVQKLFEMKLSSWNCRFQLAQTVEEADDLLREMDQKNDPFDILFLNEKSLSSEVVDIQHTFLKGLDPAKIVFMAPLIELHEEKSMQHPKNAYVLRKPIMHQQIVDCIKSVAPQSNPHSVS